MLRGCNLRLRQDTPDVLCFTCQLSLPPCVPTLHGLTMSSKPSNRTSDAFVGNPNVCVNFHRVESVEPIIPRQIIFLRIRFTRVQNLNHTRVSTLIVQKFHFMLRAQFGRPTRQDSAHWEPATLSARGRGEGVGAWSFLIPPTLKKILISSMNLSADRP